MIFPDAAHWHLKAPNGENVGHGTEGLFSEKGRRYEPVPAYLGQRIPGYKVRAALKRNEGWGQAADYFERHPEIDLDGFDPSHEPYDFFWHNCKDFIKGIEPPKPEDERRLSMLDMLAMYGDRGRGQ